MAEESPQLKNNDSKLIRDIVFEINRISMALKRHPLALEKAEFLDAAAGKFTEWDLRKLGGFGGILNAYFRYDDKDIAQIQEHKNHLSYVQKLEKTVGNRESFRNKLIKELSDIVANTKFNVEELSDSATRKFLGDLCKERPGGSNRSIVTLWSDHHFGTNIYREEVGGKNEFSWDVAARRLGKLVEQVATYKMEKRALHHELVILLAGDNIGGIIHNQEGPDFDLMVFQICGATAYYKQAITFLRKMFPRVRVICQPGNHGRVGHKSTSERVFQQKYDSFENVIFYSLSSCFAGDKGVTFEVSRAPFSDVKIQGHRVYVTHGDTVFNLGNVSNNVRLASLELQVNRINAEELRAGKGAYELFCLGHVHHPMITELSSGSRISINGTLMGTDPYALGIGIHSSDPAQLIWEATDKYVQGDVRIVNVADADKEPRHERIIRPYRYELSENHPKEVDRQRMLSLHISERR